jgi:hypothetical protein
MTLQRYVVAVSLPLVLLASFCWNSAVSFSPSLSTRQHRTGAIDTSISSSESEGDNGNDGSVFIDVSDLGLTMEDFQKPIPSELLGDFKIMASGVQSTSRIESVDDEGCLWEESSDLIGATLSIEGLRGQPVAAMDVAFSTTTCTISAFGYSVWSCLLRGECFPESALSKIEDGYDNTPLITLSISKKKDSAGVPMPLWDGFIGAIGEDSIL